MHRPGVFQHTAARRRLGNQVIHDRQSRNVSTHSRPKAAGFSDGLCRCQNCCFNTQPPEGGWENSQDATTKIVVSTHSRPKAAGFLRSANQLKQSMFQHTAARRRLGLVSTHNCLRQLFQHTAARRRLAVDYQQN